MRPGHQSSHFWLLFFFNARLLSLSAGVSCDACLKGNFRGRRFKCLICYDYDLCASCYESGATTTRHTTEHPMQCILTRVDYGKSGAAGPLKDESRLTVSVGGLCPRRPVLWRRYVFSGPASVVHVSFLWEDGLHGDVPPGPRHLGTRRNLHRGGECRPGPLTRAPHSHTAKASFSRPPFGQEDCLHPISDQLAGLFTPCVGKQPCSANTSRRSHMQFRILILYMCETGQFSGHTANEATVRKLT